MGLGFINPGSTLQGCRHSPVPPCPLHPNRRGVGPRQVMAEPKAMARPTPNIWLSRVMCRSRDTKMLDSAGIRAAESNRDRGGRREKDGGEHGRPDLSDIILAKGVEVFVGHQMC